MTDQELQQYCGAITAPDREIMDAARRRQAELAKPPGSLGKLEDYSIRLAGITGQVRPHIEKCRVLVLAADNGVTAEGISSAPTSVTLSQVINMTRHKTGMSALAHYFGNEVVVADMGIDTDRPIPGVLDRKVRRSTGNIAREPAMTRQQALQALKTGMELAAQAAADGVQALGIGEMGIGNTTTSAAVLAALTHAPAQAVTGRGGGLTDAAFEKKKQVIEQVLTLHRPDPTDPVGVLAAVGGLDLAAMTGGLSGLRPAPCSGGGGRLHFHCGGTDGGASLPRCGRVSVPLPRPYEIGYRIAAQELGQEPCLLLGMRLGEGSGCPVMFQILRAACAVMDGMATFPEAAIEDDYLAPIRAQDSFTVMP